MRQINVSTRLAVGFGSMMVMLALIAVLAWGVASRQRTVVDATSRNSALVKTVSDVKFDAAVTALAENSVAYDYASHADPSGDLQALSDSLTTTGHDVSQVSAFTLTPTQRSLLATARASYGDYSEQSRTINADLKTNTPASIARAGTGVAALAYGKIAKPLDALQAATQQQATARDVAARRSVNSLHVVILIASAIALLVALVLWQLIARSVARPLARTISLLESVARGDLTSRAAAPGSDEVGRMASALNLVLDRMQVAMQQVSGHADALATSSQELSATSSQMGDGAAEVASRAGAVSAASIEVSDNVQSAAGETERLSNSIQNITHNAGEAARIGATGLAQAEAANIVVARLAESSEAVEAVVKAITMIAGQTNLLALNATIEAARAGKVGAGFAVVANEVKQLAQQTAAATEDITRRISAIQTDTGGAISAIREIGGTLADVTDCQNAISSAVEEQTHAVEKITRAISHAAGTSAQITTRMTAVADSTAQTTTGINDTRSSSGALAATANELRSIVAQFTV